MACEIILHEGDFILARISGVLSLAELQALQRLTGEVIKAHGSARALVAAESFQGWAKQDRWDDVGFLMEYGDAVAKMAIVGEARWRDDVYAFVGKGLRETEVQFFPPDALQEAERWARA